MRAQSWLQKVWQIVGANARLQIEHESAFDEMQGGYGAVGSLLRGLAGRSMEMAEVQAEVAAECRGQILMVSRCDEAVRRLLAYMRGQPPLPPAGPVYREGFFTLATLPGPMSDRGQSTASGLRADTGWTIEEWVELGREADMLLYIFCRDTGWQADDAHWYARLRATGLPLVLVEADLLPSLRPAHSDEQPEEKTRRNPPDMMLALPDSDRAVQVSLSDTGERSGELPTDILNLVKCILAQRPKLGIPLAQEIPGCRPLIAQRAIRSGILMNTLLGAEPVPFFDLPLQVALNWKLALQIAAIYGYPGLDYRGREMIGTMFWNLALRYVTQQVLKLAPALGWVGSAALGGIGTWILGNTLVQYYQAKSKSSGFAMDRRVESRRKALAQWQQAAVISWAGLRGRLITSAAAFSRRWSRMMAIRSEGGSHG